MRNYSKTYREKNRAKILAAGKVRRKKYKARIRDSNRRYRRQNPAKMKQFALKYKYKLSVEEFLALGSACHICGIETFEGRHGAQTRHVDHDHRTGLLRGILCTLCNHGLGHFKDDPALLEHAIAYLARAAANKSA